MPKRVAEIFMFLILPRARKLLERTGTRRWYGCCSQRTASTRTKGGGYSRTPLLWAAGNGHKAVVRLLLAKDGVDPDSKGGGYSRTSLLWAVGNRHGAVVRLLLAKNGVDPDYRDS